MSTRHTSFDPTRLGELDTPRRGRGGNVAGVQGALAHGGGVEGTPTVAEDVGQRPLHIEDFEDDRLYLARLVHRFAEARAAEKRIRGFGFYRDREADLLARLRECDEALADTPTHFALRRRRQRLASMLAAVQDILKRAEADRVLAANLPRLQEEITALHARVDAEDHDG